MTLAHVTAFTNNVRVLRILIERGAKIDEANFSDEWTPLHSAISENRGLAARMLVSAGAVNAVNDSGHTPLNIACDNGHFDLMQVLLAAGADFKLASRLGTTPLHIASRNNHGAVVRVLLEAGADLEALNNLSYTPLMMALTKGHSNIARMLIDAGANLKMSHFFYLHAAVASNLTNLVRVLIEAGANVNATNTEGQTPLHLAARNGQLGIVRLLLDAGADLNAVDSAGRKPVFLSKAGSPVRRLLMDKMKKN